MKSRVRKHTAQRHIPLQKIKLKKAFFQRMHFICDQMVGPGYFGLFPRAVLNDMYTRRYPSLKVISGSKGLNQQDIVAFRQIFLRLLSAIWLDTFKGGKLDYPCYMGDAIMLIHYMEYSTYGSFKGYSTLRDAFKPYFSTSDWYHAYEQKILTQLTTTCMYLNDFYKGYLDADIEQLPFRNPDGLNVIRLLRIPPQIAHLTIEGIHRPVSRLGWYDTEHADHGTVWVCVAPERLGFEPATDGGELPVYIQQHVLTRFQERSMFPQGYIAGYLNRLFTMGQPEYHRKNENSLVAFLAGTHKIGYFLFTRHQNALIIRTFLFLTNDGTPEGNHLATLTRLKLLDKQFLGIDQMDTFFKYNIIGDEQLRHLFTRAGCGSLLDYVDECQPHISKMAVPLESTDFMHRYIGSITMEFSMRKPLGRSLG